MHYTAKKGRYMRDTQTSHSAPIEPDLEGELLDFALEQIDLASFSASAIVAYAATKVNQHAMEMQMHEQGDSMPEEPQPAN